MLDIIYCNEIIKNMYTRQVQSLWREHHTEQFPSFPEIRKYDTQY